MEQLTLEEAATKHALYKAPVYGEHHAIEGFKAGAAWQKEQDKELLTIAVNTLQAIGQRDKTDWIQTIHPIIEKALTLIEQKNKTMNPIPINYYPLHRSGCTFKKDQFLDRYWGRDARVYGTVSSVNRTMIPLLSEFEGMPEIGAQFQLFRVDDELDYNSFYSLN